MAYSHPNVNAGNRSYNLKKPKETCSHLSVLKDSTIKLGDVKVILGKDCFHLHRAIDYRKCGNAKPWAVRTKLGWMLSGPLHQQVTGKLATESLVAAEMGPLADQVKSWWSMESYASICSVSGRSKEDDKALEMLKATTKFDGERYEVGLFWKNAKPHLSNNYSSAVSQFKSLERLLEKDEKLKQRYKETIDVDVQKGFVRILDEAELENTKSDLQWYFPRLLVLNPNKPDRVRRVCNHYDAYPYTFWKLRNWLLTAGSTYQTWNPLFKMTDFKDTLYNMCSGFRLRFFLDSGDKSLYIEFLVEFRGIYYYIRQQWIPQSLYRNPGSHNNTQHKNSGF